MYSTYVSPTAKEGTTANFELLSVIAVFGSLSSERLFGSASLCPIVVGLWLSLAVHTGPTLSCFYIICLATCFCLCLAISASVYFVSSCLPQSFFVCCRPAVSVQLCQSGSICLSLWQTRSSSTSLAPTVQYSVSVMLCNVVVVNLRLLS